MGIKSFIGKQWAGMVVRRELKKARNAVVYQEKWLQKLVNKASKTHFGIDHSFHSIHSHSDFVKNVPIRDYESGRPWYDRISAGEENVCWPGRPQYLAKTSGTTSGAKHIPLTRESLPYHISAARNAMFHYLVASGKSDFIDGKMMFLSGSPEVEEGASGIKLGRLSGIVNHFIPSYLQRNRVPSYATNCIEDWEEKVNTIRKEIREEDLRVIGGIPPWIQMLFENIQQNEGREPLDLWPNLTLYIHGGVDFNAYRAVFEKYFGGKVDYWELFPASEGFFAYQYQMNNPGLLLNFDAGIFYEFVPISDYHSENPQRLSLADVKVDVPYALIVSTNAGLWAYDIGDCVKFSSLDPPCLRVVGRVKQFLSAFGEHVIEEEVSRVVVEIANKLGGRLKEYTVAPLVAEISSESKHQWFFEFEEIPQDPERLTEVIDSVLQEQNSYYKDLREGKMLEQPEVIIVKLGSSRAYMESVGKLGGQNKFPHLSNDRKIADFLMDYRIES